MSRLKLNNCSWSKKSKRDSISFRWRFHYINNVLSTAFRQKTFSRISIPISINYEITPFFIAFFLFLRKNLPFLLTINASHRRRLDLFLNAVVGFSNATVFHWIASKIVCAWATCISYDSLKD